MQAGVKVPDGVQVWVGVKVGVQVGVHVLVKDGVEVGVRVGVPVGLAVGVQVGVVVGVAVGESVVVVVSVGVGVGVKTGVGVPWNLKERLMAWIGPKFSSAMAGRTDASKRISVKKKPAFLLFFFSDIFPVPIFRKDKSKPHH